MPFLSTIEEMALEKGQQIGEQIGIKKTRQQDILDLLEKRFGKLSETLIKTIKKINDLTFLKQLVITTISVNSVAEFERLINNN